MNIGLDIDNVISAFDNRILKEFIKEDKNKRNAGMINKKARHITSGMFDWTKEEIDDFFNKNMEKLAGELSVRYNAKKYIDLLIENGHKIVLISHRVFPHYVEPLKTTTTWLQKHKICYHKLVMSESADKTKECLENNIDVMVDDRVGQCKLMKENGVNCIVMLTKYNKKEAKGLPNASSWQNLYEIISNMRGIDGKN